jgi:hypothetical protein
VSGVYAAAAAAVVVRADRQADRHRRKSLLKNLGSIFCFLYFRPKMAIFTQIKGYFKQKNYTNTRQIFLHCLLKHYQSFISQKKFQKNGTTAIRRTPVRRTPVCRTGLNPQFVEQHFVELPSSSNSSSSNSSLSNSSFSNSPVRHPSLSNLVCAVFDNLSVFCNFSTNVAGYYKAICPNLT